MQSIYKILFIELLGGIGDLIIALPAIQALGRSHPTAQLTVLTFAPQGELLEADPLIHNVRYAARGQARHTVEKILTNENFDLIVSDTNYEGIGEIIHNHQKSPNPAAIAVTNLWRSPPTDERVSDRFLHILSKEGLIHSEFLVQTEPHMILTTVERQTVRQTLGSAFRPVVFLCPDAGMPIKRWSEANFIQVGRVLQQRHKATIIVPVGSDLTQAERIVQSIGGTAQLWPRGSLRLLAAAIAEANLVIAADTAPSHLATALNIPTITLFGPSWHERYGHAPPHVNLQGFPDCPERIIRNFTEQPCWYSGHCPFPWPTCLEDISPQTVADTATQLLTPASSSSPHLPISHSPASPTSHSPTSPTFWTTLQNLLVMRLDNMGDVMMTSPALRSLRENLPHAKITLLASPSGALTAPLLPWVDEVIPWRVLWQDLGRLDFNPDREWQLIETLKTRQFEAAILFTSFSQSPHPPALICALAGIPLRLGESKEIDVGTLTHALPPAPDQLHQVERNLRLIEFVGFHVRDRHLSLHVSTEAQKSAKALLLQSSKIQNLKSEIQFVPQALDTDDQQRGSSIGTLLASPSAYFVLNPWTTCQSRNYDTTRFAIAARELSQITNFPVVVTGVEKDRDRAASVLNVLGDRAIDLVGKTNLSELVALIAGARLVLTNNTSTMHIADAMNTPSVILFAGTEMPCQWQPRRASVRILNRPTVCSPCYAFTCPYELQCLEIAPQQVVEAGLELLSHTLSGT